jgi:hypothetical protein
MPTTSPSRKFLLFIGICAAAVVAVVAYVVLRPAPSMTPVHAAITAASPEALAEAVKTPHLLFRSTDYDKGSGGQLGLVPIDALDRPPLFTPITCERVYFAAGTGVCLTAERGMTTSYRAELFDQSFHTRHQVALTGVPSRTRVAPDGSLAASTNFVNGDSYAAGGFSTRTLLMDAATGKVIDHLEAFQVTRDGKPFKAVDFNFWGVTFTKTPNRFYATLASGGEIYLIEGDVTKRTGRVVRTGIECPSLSPDNRRIAFKKRMPGVRLVWRIHVLDLESGAETALAETRSVDDQVEWLDDATILYALPNGGKARPVMDIWAAAADGSGTPRVLVTNAESPAVVRPPSAIAVTR